jgi:O-antigen/teichoic acid export membrane protein
LDWWLARKGFAGLNSLVQFFRQGILLGLVCCAQIPSIEYFAVMDVGTEGLATLALWFVGPKKKFSVAPPSVAEWKSGLGCYQGSFVLFVSSALLLLHQNVDIFFLKFFRGDTAVGVYDYCNRYALFVFLLGGSLSEPLRRQLARLKEQGSDMQSTKLVLSCHKILGTMSAGFLLFSMLFADFLFSKVVPIEVDFSTARLLVLFACWLVISFFSVPWSEWLISQSKKKYLTLAVIAGCANLLFNLWLVPIYGIFGAVLAKICSESSIFIYLFFSVDSGKRRQFAKVFYIHLLLIPCVAYFWKTGSVPLWLAIATVVVEALVIVFTKYLSKRDLQVLARN